MDADDDRTMTIPRLALLVLAGAAIWAALAWGTCTVGRAWAAGTIDHMACSRPALPMPRTVIIRPGIDPGPWRTAMAEWNAAGAATVGSSRLRFVEVGQSYEADVYILPSTTGRTWVDMPCGRIEAVVHVGSDVDLYAWATHELGHTLGLADYIYDGQSATGYLNPGRCPSGGYEGIMSYCYPYRHAFSPDDYNTLRWWF